MYCFRSHHCPKTVVCCCLGDPDVQKCSKGITWKVLVTLKCYWFCDTSDENTKASGWLCAQCAELPCFPSFDEVLGVLCWLQWAGCLVSHVPLGMLFICIQQLRWSSPPIQVPWFGAQVHVIDPKVRTQAQYSDWRTPPRNQTKMLSWYMSWSQQIRIRDIVNSKQIFFSKII